MTSTRFELSDGQKLAFTRWGHDWRIVHIDPSVKGNQGAFIGPIYKSKAELLADLDRYAKDFGF
mgnify:CR=1 FL=1